MVKHGYFVILILIVEKLLAGLNIFSSRCKVSTPTDLVCGNVQVVKLTLLSSTTATPIPEVRKRQTVFVYHLERKHILRIRVREGAINTLGGGCANLASFDPKMLTPP